MKKIFSISMLAIMTAIPAFAEIVNNTTCDVINLGQSEPNSTANIQANWNANTINIDWYDGDTKLTSNTCTYGQKITLPPQPTRAGYTFVGWRLRAKQCWEITNESECENTPGCDYDLWNSCEKLVDSSDKCQEITNQTECNGTIFEDPAYSGFCYWVGGECNASTPTGGTND